MQKWGASFLKITGSILLNIFVSTLCKLHIQLPLLSRQFGPSTIPNSSLLTKNIQILLRLFSPF